MSLRSLIFLGIACALGAFALTAMVEPDAPVMSLELSLGAEVQTTRL